MSVARVLSGWLIIMTMGCGRGAAPGSTADRGFVSHQYRDSSGNESKYIVFVPIAYDPNDASPAILFLHGAGQKGTDGVAPARGGLGDAIREREATFPFITVFPQSHAGSWLADSTDGTRAVAILDQVQQLYNVDRQRTYLTGYSMGGEGTWSIAAAHPERFAAIVPICPGSNLEVVSRLKHIPCWCFQGDADSPGRVTGTRKMVLAIKTAGGRPTYEEYPGIEHNCWDLAYRTADLYDWLLLNRLP